MPNDVQAFDCLQRLAAAPDPGEDMRPTTPSAEG